ncbi:TadE/TadG family type IV pilus assembly protein [Marinibacterium sp. SX1]|uniref:TadE/TadG family type IV pilus assembly protein n=1 Tax=Marinibacterium sp. SX1 TaxID=3388424 RepID=UPI003D174CDF
MTLARFADDTRGSVSVEFLIMMPLLFWAYMAAYVFFDGYRTSTTNLKAAYTVSDMLSRETQVVDDEYIDTMVELVKFLTQPDNEVDMRITLVYWSEDDNRYYVDWSEDRGFGTIITNGSIAEFEDKLPVLYDGDRVILMETRGYYDPDFNIGWKTQELYNAVVTRPRFAPQIVYSG